MTEPVTETLPADWFDPKAVMHDIIQAELANWVPGASQRLIHRAGSALDHPMPEPQANDCGAEPGWHALVADWAAGIYVMRCVTCARLYRH